MIQRTCYAVAVAASILFLAACETVIEIDLPDEESRLVAYSFIAPGQDVTAEVSHSVDVLGPEDNPSVVPDAVVELYRDGVHFETLSFRDGTYAGSRPPTAGASYTLQVTAPGYAPITAKDVIPVPVDAVVTEATFGPPRPHEWASSEMIPHTVTVRISDPSGEPNFYGLWIERDDTQENTSDVVRFATNEGAVIDEQEQVDIGDDGTFEGSHAVFSDALFDGRAHEFTITFTEVVMRGTTEAEADSTLFRLHLEHVSEVYYRHERSTRLYNRTRHNPFAEPVRLFSNVENGYGVLAGYSESVFEIESGQE